MRSILDPYAKENLKSLVAKFDSLRSNLPISLCRDLEDLSRISDLIRENIVPTMEAMRGYEYYSIIDKIETRREFIDFYYHVQDSRCMFCEVRLPAALLGHLAFFESIHDIILGNSIVRAEGLSVIFGGSLTENGPNLGTPLRAHRAFMAPLANIAAQGMVCLDCKRASYNAAWGGVRTIINPMIDDMADYFFSDGEGQIYFDTSEIPPASEDNPLETLEERTIDLLDLNRLSLVRKRKAIYKDFAESFANRPMSRIEFGDAYSRALSSEHSCAARSALRDAVGSQRFGKFLSEHYETGTTHPERAVYNTKVPRLGVVRPGRKIRSVSVKNYRGFSCEGVDFKAGYEPSRTQEFVPDLALLAQNGEGKTRFLQSLFWALSGREDVVDVLQNTPAEFWPKGTTIVIQFLEVDDVELYVHFPEEFGSNSIEYTRIVRNFIDKENRRDSAEMFFEFHDRIPFAAFGSHRVAKHPVGEQVFRGSLGFDDFALFSHGVPLNHLPTPHNLKKRPRAWKFISWVLTSLLQFSKSREDFFEFEYKEDEWSLNYHNGRHSPLPIEQISDGLQSVVWLGLTIVFRLFDDLKSDGIVLIDELDAHLHPSWRLVFRKALKTSFPNVQLIFTTHDPIILRGMSTSNVFRLLPPGKDGVSRALTLAEEAASLEGYEVDDLLISDLFGMGRLREPESEEQYTRYLELLAEQYILSADSGSNPASSPVRNSKTQRRIEQIRSDLGILRRRFSGGYAGYRHPRDHYLIPILDELIAVDEAKKAGILGDVTDEKIKEFKEMILRIL